MRAFLDASEVTIRCQRMERTPDLNGLWSADIRLASQYASISSTFRPLPHGKVSGIFVAQ